MLKFQKSLWTKSLSSFLALVMILSAPLTWVGCGEGEKLQEKVDMQLLETLEEVGVHHNNALNIGIKQLESIDYTHWSKYKVMDFSLEVPGKYDSGISATNSNMSHSKEILNVFYDAIVENKYGVNKTNASLDSLFKAVNIDLPNEKEYVKVMEDILTLLSKDNYKAEIKSYINDMIINDADPKLIYYATVTGSTGYNSLDYWSSLDSSLAADKKSAIPLLAKIDLMGAGFGAMMSIWNQINSGDGDVNWGAVGGAAFLAGAGASLMRYVK